MDQNPHMNAVDLSNSELALERLDSPVSPSPGGSKFTTINVKREAGEESVLDESPTKKTKITPKKPKQKDQSTPAKMKKAPIADCYESLAPEDRMVVEWRDAGKSFKEISEEWERMTSNKPGSTTLKNRCYRIKAAVTDVEPADRDKIESCRAECLEEIAVQKKALDAKLWTFIAEKMKANGAKDYAPATLEKHWKKTSAKHSASQDTAMNED